MYGAIIGGLPESSVRCVARWRWQGCPQIARSTSATWLMQAGVEAFEAAGYIGMSVETLLEVYGHQHPAFQERAARAAGRRS